MNKHLRAQAKNAPVEGTQAHHATFRPPPARSSGWRGLAITLGVVFGAYVLTGHFFLPTALQWSVVSGQIAGRREAAAIVETVPAKAAEAAAVTGAQASAGVEPAIKIAEGAERAKIDPSVEIAAQIADIEVKKAAQIARIEVAKQADVSKIQADQGARGKGAEAYQDCLARALIAADSAATRAAGQENTTLAAIDSARLITRMQFEQQCERRKVAEDAARMEAAAAAAK